MRPLFYSNAALRWLQNEPNVTTGLKDCCEGSLASMDPPRWFQCFSTMYGGQVARNTEGALARPQVNET
ncbi:hypothetical protein ACFX1R_036116 [Malus domestica]